MPHSFDPAWRRQSLAAALAATLLAGGLTLASAYTAGKFYHQVSTRQKLIALTFDDGPGPYTLKILDFLKEQDARATFFMEGSQVTRYGAIARQVAAAGQEIGNHTYSHLNFGTVSGANREQFIRELLRTQEAIEQAAGVRTRSVRMPHGAFTKNNRAWLLATLRDHGYALVHWSFGMDWHLKYSAEEMAAQYLKQAKPGAIFLFHDGGGKRDKTLAALRLIVPALRQQGYRLVAVEDLLNAQPVPIPGLDPPDALQAGRPSGS